MPPAWHIFTPVLQKYKSMKQILLLHNPGAGEESHDEKHLTGLIEGAGFKCDYQSVKEKGWEKRIGKQEIIAVAGGDGTVRKAVRALLKKDLKKMPQIGVIPLGTANNIAKTIYESIEPEAVINSWKEDKSVPFNLGWVRGLPQKHFFIEGLGFGVFPTLVRAMQTVDEAISEHPDKRIQIALELLSGIIGAYKAIPCQLEIDGADHSGEYLLVEIMNICSVGPNLMLSPDCKPGDAHFSIVLISANERQQFLDYISGKIKGVEGLTAFPTIQGSRIRLRPEAKSIHIDDKLVKLPMNATIDIELDEKRLSFLA